MNLAADCWAVSVLSMEMPVSTRRRTHVYIDVLDVIPVEKLLTQKTFEIADYSKALIEKKLQESKQQAV